MKGIAGFSFCVLTTVSCCLCGQIYGAMDTFAFGTSGHWGSQPYGDGVHFSDTNNWNWADKGLPSSSFDDTIVRAWMYGQSAVNDFADDYMMRGIEFTGLGYSNAISGNPLNLGASGLTLFDHSFINASVESAVNNGTAIVTTRVENVIRSAVPEMQIIAKHMHALELDGMLTYFGDDATNKTFHFINNGKVFIRGGMNIDKTNSDWKNYKYCHCAFSGTGTTVIASDVYVPSVRLEKNAHIVISNGATLHTWCGGSLYRQCTVDIEDGKLINGEISYVGQDSAMSGATVFNIRSKGILDTGAAGMRFANNAPAVINIYDGGVMWFRTGSSSDFCENGTMALNLYDGGQLRCGNEYRACGGILKLTVTGSGVSDYNRTSPSSLNLAGGELFIGRFEDWTLLHKKDCLTYVYLDGSTLRSMSSGDLFLVGKGGDYASDSDRIRVHLRQGGFTLDTREFDRTWNAVEIRGNDEGGVPGDFVKLGSGKLTLSVAATNAMRMVVKNGTFAVSDASLFSGAVDLRPASVLAFGGTTLSLSSLSSKSGIVTLQSGQSLSLAAAPLIDGLLVFDVAVTDGERTLVTAPGMPADIAALCAVRKPVAGKSCTFSVRDGELVLTVADGDAPAQPQFPPSEDPEVNVTGSVSFGDDAERIGGKGEFTYVGEQDKVLGDGGIRLTGDATLKLANGAGNITISGAPDVYSGYSNTLYLATDRSNAIRFTGDWSPTWPYTESGYTLFPTVGNFVYGPDLRPENLFRSFLFRSDSSHTVEGATLAFPATTGEADLSVPTEAASFILDGGTIKVSGQGGGSLSDFLGGVTTFAIGAGGGAVDTDGYDATITQTLTPTGTASGVFSKLGDGTLTLAGRENALFGGLAVSNGTLVASFDTTLRRPYPIGAMAIWSFDGEDPYSDKTGHGYRLHQSHPNTALVTFTNENALCGRAARWSSEVEGGSLYVSTNDLYKTGVNMNGQYGWTVSAWVRYTGTLRNRYANIMSSRVSAEFDVSRGPGYSFDLAYKALSSMAFPGGGYGFSSLWAGGKTAIPDSVVGHSPTLDTWHHLIAVADGRNYRMYLDGECYTDFIHTAGPGQFVPPGYMITLGEGITGGEFMTPGGMVDEVAVYPRALSEDEIQSLITASAQSAALDLHVSGGAVWDMNDSSATVKRASGAGRVVNGSLSVTERIVSDPADTNGLFVANLSLAEGGVFDLGYDEDERPETCRRTLVSFGEMDADSRAALGGWTLTNCGDLTKRSLSLKISADAVHVDVVPVGMKVIIR